MCIQNDNPTPKEREVFVKEVSILSRLHHRNIVQFYGACLQPGSMFIVTELMKGGDLYTALRNHPETMRCAPHSHLSCACCKHAAGAAVGAPFPPTAACGSLACWQQQPACSQVLPVSSAAGRRRWCVPRHSTPGAAPAGR